MKIRIYKNVILISGREETQTTVRVFYKQVTVSGGVNPQETAPKATLSRDGILTITVRTTTTTTTTRENVESKVTQVQTRKGQDQDTSDTIVTQQEQTQQVKQQEQEVSKKEMTTASTAVSKEVATRTQQSEEKVTRVRPEVTNEVVEVDSNAENITKSLVNVTEGKQLNVSKFPFGIFSICISTRV
jgi:hypothetical protein